jgi:hypothetical protein
LRAARTAVLRATRRRARGAEVDGDVERAGRVFDVDVAVDRGAGMRDGVRGPHGHRDGNGAEDTDRAWTRCGMNVRVVSVPPRRGGDTMVTFGTWTCWATPT